MLGDLPEQMPRCFCCSWSVSRMMTKQPPPPGCWRSAEAEFGWPYRFHLLLHQRKRLRCYQKKPLEGSSGRSFERQGAARRTSSALPTMVTQGRFLQSEVQLFSLPSSLDELLPALCCRGQTWCFSFSCFGQQCNANKQQQLHTLV